MKYLVEYHLRGRDHVTGLPTTLGPYHHGPFCTEKTANRERDHLASVERRLLSAVVKPVEPPPPTTSEWASVPLSAERIEQIINTLARLGSR